MELLSYPGISNEEEDAIRGLLKNCKLIELNQEIKALTIELKRKYKVKLPDAIIAATAYYLNLPVFTSDKQFSQFEELNIIIYQVE